MSLEGTWDRRFGGWQAAYRRSGSIIETMVIDMNEAQVCTLEQVRQVLAGTQAMEFHAAADDRGRYAGSVAIRILGSISTLSVVQLPAWNTTGSAPFTSKFLIATEPCLRWYCLRWRIEDWHRVLKSGCRIEALQHKTAERLKRAIAINLVIAWRIMLMTLLGRDCPDLPAEVLLSDAEIEVLQAYAKKRIAKPIRLGDAVRLVARLGGYIDRAKDPHPGHQIMWQGYSELQIGLRMTSLLTGKGQG